MQTKMTIQFRSLFSTCLLVFSLLLGASPAQPQEDKNTTNAVPSTAQPQEDKNTTNAVLSPAQVQEAENITNAVPSPTVPENKYPESIVEAYLLNCAQMAAEQGLVEEEAQSICQCTIGKFQSIYTLEQFQQLTNASANNNEDAEATLTEIGYTCFEEMYF